jgi:S1-C subfamily serine protease
MAIRFIILFFLFSFASACAQINTCAPNPTPLSLEELSLSEKEAGTESAEPNAFLGVAHRLIETNGFKQAEVSHGYLIDRVVPGSAADRIGLIAGDIILEFDGINLDLIAEGERKLYFARYIKLKKKFGDSICLKVLRQTSDIQVKGTGKTLG